MGGTSYTQEEVEAAIEALADPSRFAEAESMITRAAPSLQRLLLAALEAGGWFEEAHQEQLSSAIEIADPDERARTIRTLVAEETRIAMMIGATAGWALAEQLKEPKTDSEEE